MDRVAGEAFARAVFRALDGQHAGEMVELLDDASLLHVSGSSGLAGDYQGCDAIVSLLARMAELTDMTLRYSGCRPAVITENAVVLRGAVSATREGRTVETGVTVEVVAEQGSPRLIRVSYMDQPAWDAFWSPRW